MKKIGLFLLAVVLAVGVAGCGGGGSDPDPFDFNGTWTISYVVVASTVPGIPPGRVTTGVAAVAQSGNAITLTLGATAPISGTCDPIAGTFSASGVSGIVARIMTGIKGDGDTMSGSYNMTAGSEFIRQNYTMVLSSRAIARTAGEKQPAGAGTIVEQYQALGGR